MNVVPDAISQHKDLKDNNTQKHDHNNQSGMKAFQFLSSIIEILAHTSLDQEIMEAQMRSKFQTELEGMLRSLPKTNKSNNQGITYVKGALVVPKGGLQTKAILHMHEGPLSGRGGLLKTLKRLGCQYW
ncbi:hypothetical protein DSO57_1035824 [Entomophthora muscae]|uniref:Uncharacterized protein n=1 Tax=Entomophthora muscae TaxID=34485 RepID=A0ACC2TLJ9_9FUNG|nr:hypothetical protein DSO57_1035824 [Entomophthora muscae]